jgi:PAS domain-containing protein
MSAAPRLREVLPSALVPALLDAIPYPTIVLCGEFSIRWANSPARRLFALTDDATERLNSERTVTTPMRQLHSRK